MLVVLDAESDILKLFVIVGTLSVDLLIYLDGTRLLKMPLADIVEKWALQCIFGGEAEERVEFEKAIE